MDNDFDAPMDYDDEPEQEVEEVAASKQASKNKSRTKAEKKTRRKRRRTLQVIRDARKAGLDKVIEPSVPEQDGVRRSKRVRFQPLKYWKGEKLTVSMKSEGVGGSKLACYHCCLFVGSCRVDPVCCVGLC